MHNMLTGMLIYSASEYSSNLHKVKYSGYNCVTGLT